MDNKTALSILKDYQEWRRYNGPIAESPPMPDPKVIGMAIDQAIAVMESVTSCNKPKEYYGG